MACSICGDPSYPVNHRLRSECIRFQSQLIAANHAAVMSQLKELRGKSLVLFGQCAECMRPIEDMTDYLCPLHRARMNG